MFKPAAMLLAWHVLLTPFASAHVLAKAHAHKKAKAHPPPLAASQAESKPRPKPPQAYRCDQPSGVRYQATPCQEGGGPLAKIADVRTPAQQADTARATQDSIALGRQMERDRHLLEKQALGQRAIAMDPGNTHRPAVGGRSPEGQTLTKKDRHFTAKPPKPKRPPAGAK